MNTITRTSSPKPSTSRIKQLRKFLNQYLVQGGASFDAVLFGFIAEFKTVYSQLDMRILSISENECWQYSDTGKSPFVPDYTGFFNHLKVIQNIPLLKGRAYRCEPCLTVYFTEPKYILGLPIHLVSGKKIWILINSPEKRFFREPIVKRLIELCGKLVEVLELSDYSEIRKIADRFKVQEEAVATLVHQLKSPLSLLSQSLKRAEKKYSPDNNMFSQCRASVNKTQSMIVAYLDFMKIREMKLSPVNIRNVLKEIKSYFRYTLKESGILLNTVFIPSGKRCVILGNLFFVFQVLQNLLDNACKAAGPKGRISIEIRKCESKEATNEPVEIRVSDSGPGVDPGLAGKIFEPFVSGFKSGHGFGLSVCKRIMDLHGGSIAYVPPKPEHSGYFLLRFRSA